MRALFRAAPAALALLTVVSLPGAAQGIKVAYVQTSALLEQAPGRADAEAQFERETGTYRDQIKRMSDSLNAMVASLERSQASLAATVRDARSKDIQTREAGTSVARASSSRRRSSARTSSCSRSSTRSSRRSRTCASRADTR